MLQKGIARKNYINRWPTARQRTLKVKIKFTLEQAMKDQRGSRGIAPLFL